ncbi:MAG TPA: hypothetical protein VMW13_06615 [Dehalococcoidales bacterium]|nr:hypothetical protein [Dehalococcoidales bacterium]
MYGGVRKMRGLPDRMANGIPPASVGTMTTPLTPPGILYLTKDHGLLLVLEAHKFAPLGLFQPIS